MARTKAMAILIDGQQVSFEILPSGSDFEAAGSAIRDLMIFSCIKALRQLTVGNPELPFAGVLDDPFVDITIDLGSNKLPWEEGNITSIFITAKEELECEFQILTAVYMTPAKYGDIVRSVDLGRKFRLLSIAPIIEGSYGRGDKASRDWSVKIVCESEQAKFSDLFKVREDISRASFALELDSDEGNLLFRIYIPSGRLYAAEADKLLSLFQDWLNCAGRHGVRQDGYRTAAGQIYEFFGNESLNRQELSREFTDFSSFLAMCLDNTQGAIVALSRVGLNVQLAERMVARYSKEIRRLQLDLHHARESRLLDIRHSLESELLDTAISSEQWSQICWAIDVLVPEVGGIDPLPLLALPRPVPPTVPVMVSINQLNQQVISAVESTVTQNIQGTINLGAQAKELMDLVSRFGGQETTTLESAVNEFEDPAARSDNHVRAKQRLRKFLVQLAGKVEDATLAALMKYLETKVGI